MPKDQEHPDHPVGGRKYDAYQMVKLPLGLNGTGS